MHNKHDNEKTESIKVHLIIVFVWITLNPKTCEPLKFETFNGSVPLRDSPLPLSCD